MDRNIDESRRKPRRTRGTPSFQYRNRVAAGCIVLGTAIFAAFACTPLFREANKKLYTQVTTETEEERDRRYLFQLGAPRRGEAILKTMQEKKEMDNAR